MQMQAPEVCDVRWLQATPKTINRMRYGMGRLSLCVPVKQGQWVHPICQLAVLFPLKI